MTVTEFINSLIPGAVDTYHRTGVLPSITIAQAALESGWGESGLAKGYNNLFGIKGTGPAGSVDLPSKEEINGKTETYISAFKVYNNFAESITDHATLLLNDRYSGVRSAADYKTAAYALSSAGYATDSQYAPKLIGIIQENKLYEIDTKYSATQGGPITMPALNFDSIKTSTAAATSAITEAAQKPGSIPVILGVTIGGVVIILGLITLLK